MTVAQSIVADLRTARDKGLVLSEDGMKAMPTRDGWLCASWFYSTFRPTFAQRVSLDLKPLGYVIASETCSLEAHRHKGPIHRYKLIAEPKPEQQRLAIK